MLSLATIEMQLNMFGGKTDVYSFTCIGVKITNMPKIKGKCFTVKMKCFSMREGTNILL